MMSAMTGVSHQNYPVQDNHFSAPGSPSSVTNSKKRKQSSQYTPAEPMVDLNFTPFQQPQWDGSVTGTISNTSSHQQQQHHQQEQQDYDMPAQSIATDMDRSIWANQTLDDFQSNFIDSNLEKSSSSSSSFAPFMQNDLYHTPTPPPASVSTPLEQDPHSSRALNDIHQMLELDSSFDNYLNGRPEIARLQLSDLQLHHPHQSQFMQNWMSSSNNNNMNGNDNTNGGSPVHSPPAHQQSPFSPNTPNFFTPSFLGALHEDEESNFGSSQTFPTMGRNTSHFETPSVEQGTIMTSIVSHTSGKVTPPILFTHKNNNSPPLSPEDQGSYSSSSASPPYGQNIMSSFDNTSQQQQLHLLSTNDLLSDEQRHSSRMLYNSLVTMSPSPSSPSSSTVLSVNEALIKPLIQNYLSSENPIALGEKTVVILTSKVAQKSYGTEKRFLCPPPTAILVGTSWWTGKANDLSDMLQIPVNETSIDQIDGMLAPPKLSVLISGEPTNQAQPGQIEWHTVSGDIVGQTGHVKNIQQHQQQQQQQQQQEHPSRFRSSESRNNNNIDWYHNEHREPLAAGKSVFKHLFINDADEKRKRVECLIKLQSANGVFFGNFASKGIKVISKPSKKRQSVKNMELCIHHGTTVSLFNRIRSQTVSTKYLGVSTGEGSLFTFPGQEPDPKTNQRGFSKEANEGAREGTCFVARTSCWDPFVIWIVDTTRNPGEGRESDVPEDYIGHNTHARSVHYPPPPAIAMRNKTNQLIPIHYNQHIVLQCLTTGLVSPVMIIRKVDKASTVVGGARVNDDLMHMFMNHTSASGSSNSGMSGGGEYGDEVLGDPVSQLHKVALQIVQDPTYCQAKSENYFDSNSQYPNLNQQQQQQQQVVSMPKSSHPVTYLACLNDMVGMHRTSENRKLFMSESNSSDLFDITSQEGGKVVRKRRVSTDTNNSAAKNLGKLNTSMSLNDLRQLNSPSPPPPLQNSGQDRRRVNSLNNNKSTISEEFDISGYFNGNVLYKNSNTNSNSNNNNSGNNLRKSSVSSASSSSTFGRRGSMAGTPNGLGSYWCEDVSDASVWTIVGTDCATYTFWPSPLSNNNIKKENDGGNEFHTTTGPTNKFFPSVHHVSMSSKEFGNSVVSLHGENFSGDLQVWFGDVKAVQAEYKGRELMTCKIPTEVLVGGKESYPILLVRGDGTICKTNKTYPFI